MQTPDIIWIAAFLFIGWFLFIRKDKAEIESKTGRHGNKKKK